MSDPERRASETEAINRSWERARALNANSPHSHTIGFRDGVAWAESRRTPSPATAALMAHMRGELDVWPGNAAVRVPTQLAEAAVAEHEPATEAKP